MGYINNVAARINGSDYHSLSAIKKENAKISRESLIQGNPDLIIYDELFMMRKNAPLKLNIVTKLPPDFVGKIHYKEYLESRGLKIPVKKKSIKKTNKKKNQNKKKKFKPYRTRKQKKGKRGFI